LSYSSGERGRIPAPDGTNAAKRAFPRSNWSGARFELTLVFRIVPVMAPAAQLVST